MYKLMILLREKGRLRSESDLLERFSLRKAMLNY